MDTITLHPLILAALELTAGLALLLVSAKYFIDGVAFFAEIFGVPPLVIGMTLVAFGTSTPELVVNSLAASRGETGLAFGNIVGSCTVNIGVVLGITAIVRPLRVEPSIITREIPMLLVAVAGLLILSHDRALGDLPADVFGRADGLMLMLLFSIFLYYTVIYSMARRRLGITQDAFIEEVAAEQEPKGHQSMLLRAVVTVVSLAGVTIGADWTVEAATSLAAFAGISDNVIGLTVVSLGTTLPELVTCVMAARQGNVDIALGNIVGSNLFNILAIGGAVSVIHPVAIPAGGHWDLGMMALLTCVLLPITIRSGQTVTRAEGAFLLVVYSAYLAYRVASL